MMPQDFPRPLRDDLAPDAVMVLAWPRMEAAGTAEVPVFGPAVVVDVGLQQRPPSTAASTEELLAAINGLATEVQRLRQTLQQRQTPAVRPARRPRRDIHA